MTTEIADISRMIPFSTRAKDSRFTTTPKYFRTGFVLQFTHSGANPIETDHLGFELCGDALKTEEVVEILRSPQPFRGITGQIAQRLTI